MFKWILRFFKKPSQEDMDKPLYRILEGSNYVRVLDGVFFEACIKAIFKDNTVESAKIMALQMLGENEVSSKKYSNFFQCHLYNSIRLISDDRSVRQDKMDGVTLCYQRFFACMQELDAKKKMPLVTYEELIEIVKRRYKKFVKDMSINYLIVIPTPYAHLIYSSNPVVVHTDEQARAILSSIGARKVQVHKYGSGSIDIRRIITCIRLMISSDVNVTIPDYFSLKNCPRAYELDIKSELASLRDELSRIDHRMYINV